MLGRAGVRSLREAQGIRAGGFGEPIFTGIRLNDHGIILQGAIPGALLALFVQKVFELLERLVVPKGRRLKSTD